LYINFVFYQTTKEGAETVIYAVLSSQLNGKTGLFIEDSALSTSSTLSHNESDQEMLWKITWKSLSKWMNGKSINDI
jgi:hypothetical protein